MATENKEKERLVYSAYDLVELLGLSISSVYKGIADNQIPHVRVGSRILIPRKMLDEWLSKRDQG
jgi:excisionase family DNA binding protein